MRSDELRLSVAIAADSNLQSAMYTAIEDSAARPARRDGTFKAAIAAALLKPDVGNTLKQAIVVHAFAGNCLKFCCQSWFRRSIASAEPTACPVRPRFFSRSRQSLMGRSEMRSLAILKPTAFQSRMATRRNPQPVLGALPARQMLFRSRQLMSTVPPQHRIPVAAPEGSFRLEFPGSAAGRRRRSPPP